jgi:L-ascorbate metabolism protein UlaG (beta-lactamase superfamily)
MGTRTDPAHMARFKHLSRMIFDRRGAPVFPAERPHPAGWSNDGITGSCLGHSTVLINFAGVRILTDPVFSTRVGPGCPPFVLGPKRHVRPALRPRDFDAPDVLVLSHAHFDHFDVASLRQFSRDTPVVTARDTADLLRRRFRDVHELDWGQSLTLAPRGDQLKVTALEVAHWGARILRDAHRGYNGYLLEREGHSICFGGDTAYTSAFARLAARRQTLDLMLMPIGAYNPWIRAHCSPEQAVAMASQAGARTFVPIHHETFQLSSEPMSEPAERIRAAFADEPERLLAVRVGATFRVPLDSTLIRGPIRPMRRHAA